MRSLNKSIKRILRCRTYDVLFLVLTMLVIVSGSLGVVMGIDPAPYFEAIDGQEAYVDVAYMLEPVDGYALMINRYVYVVKDDTFDDPRYQQLLNNAYGVVEDAKPIRLIGTARTFENDSDVEFLLDRFNEYYDEKNSLEEMIEYTGLYYIEDVHITTDMTQYSSVGFYCMLFAIVIFVIEMILLIYMYIRSLKSRKNIKEMESDAVNIIHQLESTTLIYPSIGIAITKDYLIAHHPFSYVIELKNIQSVEFKTKKKNFINREYNIIVTDKTNHRYYVSITSVLFVKNKTEINALFEELSKKEIPVH